MIRCAAICAALVFAAACSTVRDGNDVVLDVAGEPIAASATGKPYLYTLETLPEGEPSYGRIEQQWSMLGREDKAAAVTGSSEYAALDCPLPPGSAVGLDAILDTIAAEARATRIVIVNESHTVTRHRDFTRRLIERLRHDGFTTFAAETFSNTDDGTNPVNAEPSVPWPRLAEGYYSSEPVYGRLLRAAKAAGYRLAAYEQVHNPDAMADRSSAERIAAREEAQAQTLAQLVSEMSTDEKLIVHVGYSHADESLSDDPEASIWMAARLKRLTGIDPLTIDQTNCRGGSDTVRLLEMPHDEGVPFDFSVDHPLDTFAFGRPEWRFEDGFKPVVIPDAYREFPGPLVIEAFRVGEPFDATPEDRVYVEPGEDVRLSLRPGRYTVRAVRLGE